MAKEDKVINIIKKRIQEAPDDSVFFNNSFPEFDDEYVGQILSSLSKQGVIHHLSRGVYVKAIETRFGLVYPSVHKIAEAIAKRDSAEIIPTGAAAENYLGLSTQVPMKYVYLTSGCGGWSLVRVIGVPTVEAKGKKPATILEPDDILTFGKYKGRKVIDVYCENYQYLQWAEGNVKDFLVNWQALMRVHREKRNQSAADNQTYPEE